MKDIEIVKNDTNNITKYSTKGLKKIINKELVIKLELDEEIAEYVLKKLATKVKDGFIIEDRETDDELLNCKIYFVVKDDEITIVFPDVRMKYPWDDKCDSYFKQQII